MRLYRKLFHRLTMRRILRSMREGLRLVAEIASIIDLGLQVLQSHLR